MKTIRCNVCGKTYSGEHWDDIISENYLTIVRGKYYSCCHGMTEKRSKPRKFKSEPTEDSNGDI